MAKRFGPRLGAGVGLVEKDAEKSVTPDALGTVAYVGPLDRGPIGELIAVSGPRDLVKKTGAYIPDSLVPDCARDFWGHSEGAGVQFFYRITDGTQVKASLTLFNRSTTLRKAVTRVDAKNGGSWAGRRSTIILDMALVTDVGVTTIQLPLAYVVPKNYWAGGTVTISVISTTYKVVSNTVGTGIGAGAVLTLEADQDADTDYGVNTDLELVLKNVSTDVWGRDKQVAVEIKDGESDPTNYWGMDVYLDGEVVRSYADLSSDPANKRYYVDLITNDEANHYISVTDLWTGGVTAATRPANHFGAIAAGAITATVLTLSDAMLAVDTSSAGSNTIAAFTIGASVIRDQLKISYVVAGVPNWVCESMITQIYHTFPDPVSGVIYAADNPYSIGFTLTENTPQDGEFFLIDIHPLVADEAIGGKVFIDTVNFPYASLTISDNDEEGITISSGDLTTNGIAGDFFRLQYPQELQAGYDGLANLSAASYTPAFDVTTSLFNTLAGKGYGLIKFATPGITEALTASPAVVVQQAGRAYAEANNHQFRVELPKGTVDEFVARTYVLTTVGKSDHMKVIMPSYWKVQHPVKTDLLRDVPLTGRVHGREAREAFRYGGYHKPAAGLDNTLDGLVKPPTGLATDTILNHEILNPAGIQAVMLKGGRWVIWGARLPALDPAWKFANHREQMSYYEHILLASYDWIIFKLNNPDTWAELVASLQSFFIPEWRKGAIQGDDFEDGVQIKVDNENNTAQTTALGDMHAEIIIRPADMVERCIFTVGKKGVFTTVAAAA